MVSSDPPNTEHVIVSVTCGQSDSWGLEDLDLNPSLLMETVG